MKGFQSLLRIIFAHLLQCSDHRKVKENSFKVSLIFRAFCNLESLQVYGNEKYSNNHILLSLCIETPCQVF